MSPRAIIAEDEPALAQYLRRRLAALWPELVIDGVAVNGAEALQLIEATQPQIAFLDIKMPGLTGLEVAERVGKTTHIVFVTAYDEFAVRCRAHSALRATRCKKTLAAGAARAIRWSSA